MEQYRFLSAFAAWNRLEMVFEFRYDSEFGKSCQNFFKILPLKCQIKNLKTFDFYWKTHVEYLLKIFNLSENFNIFIFLENLKKRWTLLIFIENFWIFSDAEIFANILTNRKKIEKREMQKFTVEITKIFKTFSKLFSRQIKLVSKISIFFYINVASLFPCKRFT